MEKSWNLKTIRRTVVDHLRAEQIVEEADPSDRQIIDTNSIEFIGMAGWIEDTFNIRPTDNEWNEFLRARSPTIGEIVEFIYARIPSTP